MAYNLFNNHDRHSIYYSVRNDISFGVRADTRSSLSHTAHDVMNLRRKASIWRKDVSDSPRSFSPKTSATNTNTTATSTSKRAVHRRISSYAAGAFNSPRKIFSLPLSDETNSNAFVGVASASPLDHIGSTESRKNSSRVSENNMKLMLIQSI